MHVTVPNVLATRYASPELKRLWSPEYKIVLERELWLEVLRAQSELGAGDIVVAMQPWQWAGYPNLMASALLSRHHGASRSNWAISSPVQRILTR